MGQEIELKMSIGEIDVERLFLHPFIVRHTTGPVIKKHLINHYFDTPDQLLRRHAMALRIRFDGSTYVQTLKQKGKSRDGLTIRGEWEWEVNGLNVEPKRVPSDLWPPALKDCPDRLIPRFRTDFHRTLRSLRIHPQTLPGRQKPTRVEMSLDQGVVTTDTGHGTAGDEATILEVEFELLEGDADVLIEISRRLAADISLTPCDVSKAERGYRLLDALYRPPSAF